MHFAAKRTQHHKYGHSDVISLVVVDELLYRTPILWSANSLVTVNEYGFLFFLYVMLQWMCEVLRKNTLNKQACHDLLVN
jgi:hypothetical protein